MAETRYRKGDLVRFRWGTGSMQGVVREDRGPIGVKGRRLYLVEFHLDSEPDVPSLIELPAVDMQAVKNGVAKE